MPVPFAKSLEQGYNVGTAAHRRRPCAAPSTEHGDTHESNDSDPDRKATAAVGLLTINRPKTLNALDVPTLLALEAAFGGARGRRRRCASSSSPAPANAPSSPAATSPISTAAQGLPHYHEFAEVDPPRVPPLRGLRQADHRRRSTAGRWAAAPSCCWRSTSAWWPRRPSSACPRSRSGLFPGAGGTQRIIRQIPLCRAKELMFTGDQISAAEAVALGLCQPRRAAREADGRDAGAGRRASPRSRRWC